jgi:uncharacterized protein YlxW (UPF0749 family)
MSLLVDLSSSSLDPGYAAAAARRAQQADEDVDDAGRRGRSGVALAAGVLAATLLIVIAGVQAHVRAPAAARTRADLATTVQRQARSIDDLARQVNDLRAAVPRLRDASLAGSSAGAALSATIRAEELASGAVAVSGPGLRVTLDDAPTAADNNRNRVLDRDLQAVVNALWAAGAEAVAINGERLTVQSAIRQAGDAILVDFAPLAPPYQVEAVGNAVAIETSFASSPAAGRLRSYTQLYGLRFDYSRQTRLRLPAAAEETLHYARPLASPTARGGTR